MKSRIDLLFRNGEREDINLELNKETDFLAVKEVMDTVREAFREGEDAVITFGDGATSGHIVRVSDLSCFKITHLGDSE